MSTAVKFIDELSNTIDRIENDFHNHREDDVDVPGVLARVTQHHYALDLKQRSVCDDKLLTCNTSVLAAVFAIGINNSCEGVSVERSNGNLFFVWGSEHLQIMKRNATDFVACIPTGDFFQGVAVRKTLIASTLFDLMNRAIEFINNRPGSAPVSASTPNKTLNANDLVHKHNFVNKEEDPASIAQVLQPAAPKGPVQLSLF